jgi:hypothetical protein
MYMCNVSAKFPAAISFKVYHVSGGWEWCGGICPQCAEIAVEVYLNHGILISTECKGYKGVSWGNEYTET